MNRLKQLVILSPFLVGIVLLMMWFYLWNVGTLKIHSNVLGFNITMNKKREFCAKRECELKIKTGLVTMQIEKEGYHPTLKKAQVYRGKTTPMEIEMIKIAQLIAIAGEPKEKPIPEIPENVQKKIIKSWSPGRKQLLFWDEIDQGIKIWTKDRIQTITHLTGLASPAHILWSPQEDRLMIQHKEDLYLIGIDTGSRQKLIWNNTTPKNILWLKDNERVLINDEKKNVFLMKATQGSIEKIPEIQIDLSYAVSIGKEEVVYANTENENTVISLFELSSGSTRRLLQKNGMTMDQITWSEEEKAVFLHTSVGNQWLRLDL